MERRGRSRLALVRLVQCWVSLREDPIVNWACELRPLFIFESESWRGAARVCIARSPDALPCACGVSQCVQSTERNTNTNTKKGNSKARSTWHDRPPRCSRARGRPPPRAGAQQAEAASGVRCWIVGCVVRDSVRLPCGCVCPQHDLLTESV